MVPPVVDKSKVYIKYIFQHFTRSTVITLWLRDNSIICFKQINDQGHLENPLFSSFLPKMILSQFCHLRRLALNQSSPVQPISESRWGYHERYKRTDGIRRMEIIVSNIGCLTDPVWPGMYYNPPHQSLIFFLQIFEQPSLQNSKSQGPHMRECSPPSMCHISRVQCHMSLVKCHLMFLLLYIVLELVDGGWVINKATLSRLFKSNIRHKDL